MVVPALSACGGSTAPSPRPAADAYLAAWSASDWAAMARLVADPPADFTTVNQQANADLGVRHATYTAGHVSVRGNRATVAVTASRTLGGFGNWTATTTLVLSRSGSKWRVVWTPRTIDPHLGPGDRFATDVTWPARAPILGAAGAPLTTSEAMVHVGLVGVRVTDPARVTAGLVQAGATPAEVSSALATSRAHPQWFVDVFDITEARYQQVQSVIYPIPGTTFEPYTQRQAVTVGLGQHLVGTVGPATAQQLAQLGPPYQAGDVVGQTGLEAAFERRLAGTPGGRITVVDAAGHAVATVATYQPIAGAPLQTTISPPVQAAAEAAIAGQGPETALVAVKASTGEVLAVAWGPSTEYYDIALDGEYPPGSTFKVVTSADLIEHGLNPQSPAPCPATITVGGRTFHNFEGEASNALTLQEAFAESCNAAFIGLAQSTDLPYASFPATAAQFGIGLPIAFGIPAFAGSVPAPASDTDRAATAIGQAQVVVSPLVMADVAASVASGAYHAPRLVTGSADDTAAPKPIDVTVLTDLRAMMQAVVTSSIGTAAGAGLPAGTSGKTGTAEFGTANPPQTHAWFIGYNGDLAFAVLSVGGGVGGQVAAPIAARFLDQLGPAGIAAVG